MGVRFKEWIQQEQDKIENQGYKIKLKEFVQDDEQEHVEGLTIDFDSEKYIARIVIYDFGEYQFHAIDIASEETIFFEYISSSEQDKLSEVFKKFFATISLKINEYTHNTL